MPPRRQRIQISKDLKLGEKQVYKWFWEECAKKARIRDRELAQNMVDNMHQLTAEQKFEVFVSGAFE